MTLSPRGFIESADIDLTSEESALFGSGDLESEGLDLDKLPEAVVSGTTLIDFANTPSLEVRAGVSQAMLFASRVATKAMKPGDDEDDWLAAYTSNLSQLGFSVSGGAIVKSSFKKVGLQVHKAIIPFLTVAFGGGAVGPIILAGLKNLQEMQADSPWITLFDRATRRFDAQEMHFAAVASNQTETTIRYAVVRLHVETEMTSVLFFKLTKASADFESSTTSMTANNAVIALIEPGLRARLAALSASFIAGADL